MFSIKGLSNADIETVKKFMLQKEVPKNSLVYDYGVDAHSMYFIESGALKLVERKATDGRDDVFMSIVKPGGFCGEEALLSDESRYQHTAVAVEPSVVLALSREALQRLMSTSMSIGTKILLGISKNYREAIVTQETTARTLVFYSPKDGVGSTTLAVNVAVKLAKAQKKVAFIDADFQFGNAFIYFGITPSLNISRLVQLEEDLLFDRIKLFLQPAHGVDVLCGPDLPQEAEIITRSNLNQIVRELSKKYDYLVIDVQSHLDESSLLLWDSADQLILVARPDLSCLSRLVRLTKVFSRLDYPKDKFLYLLNRFRPEDGSVKAEFQKIASGGLHQVSYNHEVTQTAEIKGVPLVLQAPLSNTAKDIDLIVDHLMGNAKKPVERGGIFGRLKSMFA